MTPEVGGTIVPLDSFACCTNPFARPSEKKCHLAGTYVVVVKVGPAKLVEALVSETVAVKLGEYSKVGIGLVRTYDIGVAYLFTVVAVDPLIVRRTLLGGYVTKEL